MRPIKFRVYNTKTKRWTVSVCVYGDGSWGASFGELEGYDETDGCVLMQFTGHLDKHGKDIYEGDILYHEDIRQWPKTVHATTAQRIAKYPMEPILVEWNESMAGYDPFVSQNDEGGPYFYSERIEVVGNIYENGNLLERHQ